MKKDYIYCPAGEILTAVHVVCMLEDAIDITYDHFLNITS